MSIFPACNDWTQYKKSKSEVRILEYIAEKGIQSKTTLVYGLFQEKFHDSEQEKDPVKKEKMKKQTYKKYYPTINDAVFKLVDKEDKKDVVKMLQLIESKKTKYGEHYSKPQNYFGLTDDGVKWLVNKHSLSPNKFAKLIITVFNEENNHKLSVSIEKIVSDYEKNYFQISRDYFNSISTIKILNVVNKIYNDKIFLEKIKKPLMLLIKNKNLNSQKQFEPELIKLMINRGLVINWVTQKKRNILRPSHFGLLLSLIDVLEKIISKEKSQQILKKELRQIIKINKEIFPFIFPQWEEFSKLFDGNDEELLSCLLYPHFDDEKQFIGKYNQGDLLLSIALQNDSEIVFREKFREEYNALKTALMEWAIENNCIHVLFDRNMNPSLLVLMTARPVVFKRLTNQDVDIIIEGCEKIRKVDIRSEKQRKKFLKKKHEVRRELNKKHEVKMAEFFGVSEEFVEFSKQFEKEKDPNSIRKILEPWYFPKIKRDVFMNHYLNDSISKLDAKNKITKMIKPIQEFAKLHEIVSVIDNDFSSLYSNLFTSEKHRLKSIENIITFYFFTCIIIKIGKPKLLRFLENANHNKLLEFYDNWINIIQNAGRNNDASLERLKLKVVIN